MNPIWLFGTCSVSVGVECNRGILVLDTMACEPASKTHHCFKCDGEFKFFQMANQKVYEDLKVAKADEIKAGQDRIDEKLVEAKENIEETKASSQPMRSS